MPPWERQPHLTWSDLSLQRHTHSKWVRSGSASFFEPVVPILSCLTMPWMIQEPIGQESGIPLRISRLMLGCAWMLVSSAHVRGCRLIIQVGALHLDIPGTFLECTFQQSSPFLWKSHRLKIQLEVWKFTIAFKRLTIPSIGEGVKWPELLYITSGCMNWYK